MGDTAYRMTTAAKILWWVYKEKGNSDLRADDPDFLHALNNAFNARDERIAELERERDNLRADCERVIDDKHKALTDCAKAISQRDSAQALLASERDEAVETLATIERSADEMAELLREQWKAPDKDAITLFCAAFLAGFAAQWKENPPQNGFTSAVCFPGCGKLEIDIRKIEGKSAAESICELQALLKDAVEVLSAALKQMQVSATAAQPGCTCSLCCVIRQTDAFLSRPEVKAMGGRG